MRWWATRIRRFVRYVTGRVTRAERAELAGWLTAAQLDLFEQMHRADQRHGLDVVAALQHAGYTDPELLFAGLLHDAGKGRDLHVWHRVAWALAGQHPRLRGLFVPIPTFGTAFSTMAVHADRSAELALRAGCSNRTADLIRQRVEDVDAELMIALRLADEAS